MIDSLFTQLATIELIDWVAMFAGILGVLLSIKERPSAWPLFILCYSVYIYISLRSRYYAFAGMNVGFVVIAIYGWYNWSGAISQDTGKKKPSPEISSLPQKLWLFVFLFLSISTVAIGLMLLKVGAARFPFWDAFAVSNALIAQWMLSQKHIENWIFWILSDLVYITLFLNDKLWPSVILFGAFIILACKGWHDWQKSIKNDASASNS